MTFMTLMKNPNIHVKIIELLLCIVGTTVLATKFVYYDAYSRGVDVILMMAIPNSIIIISVLILLIILDSDHFILNALMCSSEGLLNICAAGILLYHIQNYSAWLIVLIFTTFTCGVLMFIDIFMSWKFPKRCE